MYACMRYSAAAKKFPYLDYRCVYVCVISAMNNGCISHFTRNDNNDDDGDDDDDDVNVTNADALLFSDGFHTCVFSCLSIR